MCCFYDEDRWHEDYENSEASHYTSYEEYEHNREVDEYGSTDEELGIDDWDD